MNRAISEFFPSAPKVHLPEIIKIPDDLPDDLFKCRIIYSDKIQSVDFQPYVIKPVNRLKIVYDDTIAYDHKYLERSSIKRHLENVEGDEILIVKSGLITDTSYSNVVFGNSNCFVTPSTPLLKGTKREKLLNEGSITEREIRLKDLHEFSYVYLINAMIDLEDNLRVPVENIIV